MCAKCERPDRVKELLYRLVEKLNYKERIAVKLYLDGVSFDDIAYVLSWDRRYTENFINSFIKKVKEKVKEIDR